MSNRANLIPAKVWPLMALSAALVLLPACDRTATPENTAAGARGNSESEKALLRELRKLNAAVKTGMSSTSYGELLVGAVMEIESRLPEIADGPFKENVVASLQAFKDANDFWARFTTRYRMAARAGLKVAAFTAEDKKDFSGYTMVWVDPFGRPDQSDTCLNQAALETNLSSIWGRGEQSLKLAEEAAK